MKRPFAFAALTGGLLALAAGCSTQSVEPPRERAAAWTTTELAQQRLDQVIDAIMANYFRPIEERTLIEACLRSQRGDAVGATRGDALLAFSALQDAALDSALDRCFRAMAGALDKNSEYMDAAQFESLVRQSRSPGGVGLELVHSPAGAAIVSPLEGAPGEAAGLRRGDVIVSIDGQDVSARPLQEVRDLLRGTPGSIVVVGIRRAGEVVRIPVRRELVRAAPVFARRAAPGVTYVSIMQFNTRTLEELLRALATARYGESGTENGLILDLRWSSGGLLETAIALCAVFLEDDLAVMELRGIKGAHQTFRTRPADYGKSREAVNRLAALRPELRSVPLVVLVGRGTTSGAEVVAAALQDHRRAGVLGQTTGGAGLASAVVPLLWRSAIRLTSGSMHRPNGVPIQGHGVQPDLVVASAPPLADGLPPALPHTAVRGLMNDPLVARAVALLSQQEPELLATSEISDSAHSLGHRAALSADRSLGR